MGRLVSKAVAVPELPAEGSDVESLDDLPPLEELPAARSSLEERPGTCAICLEEGSVLQLGCAHTYCAECLEGQLSARWPGPRVTFQYLHCALCRAPLAHPHIEATVKEHGKLRECAISCAVKKFCEDNSVDPGDDDVEARAEAEMAVYMCDDCKEPYCAGRVDCAAAFAEAEVAEPARRCQACEWNASASSNDRRCLRHGHRFAMFKCDSCCAVATWNCYSNHYCERCHNMASVPKDFPCPGPDLCPLGMPHPRNLPAVHGHNVASFVIGCTACLGDMLPQDVEFAEQNQFGYGELEWWSFSSAEDLLGHVGEQEVRDRLLAHGTIGGSAEECADQLLLIGRDAESAQLKAAVGQERQALDEEVASFREEEEVETAHLNLRMATDGLLLEVFLSEPEVNVDPVELKPKREAIRNTSMRREGARHERIVEKLARLRRCRHHNKRGGRHKVAAIEWPEAF